MAYNPYFPAGYQPYYPANAFSTQQSAGNNQPNTHGALIWVQGEAGAKSYLVAPGQTVQLWDSESQTIYLKSADASGMPSIRILDYTMRDAQKQDGYATREEVSRLEEEINMLKERLKNESDLHGAADKRTKAKVQRPE